MKVHLLQRDRDPDVHADLRDAIFDAIMDGSPLAIANARRNLAREQTSAGLPPRLEELATDLELDTLWTAMAAGDQFIFETVRRVVLSSLSSPGDMIYRQEVLADCLARPALVRELYDLAIGALESNRKVGSLWHNASADTVLHQSVRLLTLYAEALRRLHDLAERAAEDVRSEGLRSFFAMVREEVADEYLATVEQHLRDLRFDQGVLESAGLGTGDKGRDYVVHRQPERSWTQRLSLRRRGPRTYTFSIAPRDEGGFRALAELRSRGISRVADAVARSVDHVQSFFAVLRFELAFYLGCLNLHERLAENGEPACMPTPLDAGASAFRAEGLFDVCLALHLPGRVVGSDLDADGRALVMVTGANQGGKSTFLRSVGVAQLMMQSGMFVGAAAFTAAVRSGVFTHFKREEDAGLEGGKLDEELRRMSEIADAITPGALLLCNESFASTNEREGSEIARQVVRAMLDSRIRVVFVTHLYDLAGGLHAERRADALFLRPERRDDGQRTFRLLAGEPLPTSYGRDSYRRIFGPSPAPALETDASVDAA